MKKMILAVVGLPGAGKSAVTNYIMKKTGWPKVYFGQTVFDEVTKRGSPLTEEHERQAREDLRKEYGMAAMAILNLPKIKELYATSSVILESFYSWEEYLVMKKEFGDDFKVLAIFASPEIRGKRLLNRPQRPLSPQEFESRDYAQIENSHQAGPIARADFMVLNEDSVESLYKDLDRILEKIYEGKN